MADKPIVNDLQKVMALEAGVNYKALLLDDRNKYAVALCEMAENLVEEITQLREKLLNVKEFEEKLICFREELSSLKAEVEEFQKQNQRGELDEEL